MVDTLDLTDKLQSALDDCYGCLRGLSLIQQQETEDSAFAGVLLRSLDGVYNALDEVTAAIKDGELVPADK